MRSEAKRRHAEIAQKILDVALEGDMRPGQRLPESALAKTLGISRTPVRAALALLEEQGFAHRAAQGGFTLAVDFADGSSVPKVTLRTTEGALADAILQDRLARRLGEAVTIPDLCRRYGANRAGIQDALEILAARELLHRESGQSWHFSRLFVDRNALEESYDFRLMLEPAAVLDPGFRLDRNRAAAVRARTEQLLSSPANSIAAEQFHEADLAFHELIASGCNNRYIAEGLTAHHRLRHLPATAPNLSDHRIRQSLEEHLKVLDQLEQGHREIAADLMRLHLRISRERRPSLANRGAPAMGRMMRKVVG